MVLFYIFMEYAVKKAKSENMNPMVCYIYEYKGSQRMRNCGFLKIRPSSDKYIVQMHIRSPLIRTGDTWQLFLFYKEDTCCVLYPLLSLSGEQRAMNQQINLPRESIPNQKSLEELDGLMLRSTGDTVFAAPWLNVPLDVSNYRMWDASSAPEEPSDSDEAIIPEEPSTPEEVIPPEEPDPEPVSSMSDEDALSPVEKCVEQSLEPEVSPCDLCQEETSIPCTCHKIARNEISSLPRKYWYLANNSFLLHGYHNYHHLVLVEENGKVFLGVPGICDRREAQAAQLYGFPHFSDEYITHLDLTENEKNHCQRFGHWFREI